MSKVVFPQKPQTPLYAIRSCIADRANTVNRTEFENLKLVVNDSKIKCDAVVKKTNDVIDATNALSERSNLFAIVFDSLYTFIYPTDTLVFSSKEPATFIQENYQQDYGVWGYFSGNWGWIDEPIDYLTFKYHTPVEPDTPKEEAAKAPIIEEKIPIYVYWCKKAEDKPPDLPDNVPPPIPKIPTDDEDTPTETNP